jgi:hypothetical protein
MEYWTQTIGQNAGNAQKAWAVLDWMANPGSGGGGGTPPPSPPPSGSTNLALNKPATASSTESGKTPAMANDGSGTTRWAAANGNFPAWWEVDLGSAQNLGSTELTFEGSSAWKYRIEGRATTGDAWTTLVDRTGNTSTAQTYTDTLANGSNKRYLRVTITGYQGGYFWASLFEVKVFAASGGGGGGGTPPPSGSTNLALNKTATASSTESGKTPAMANDGSGTTRWAAANGNFPAWWEVDLGSAQNLGSTELTFEGSSAWKYRIEGRATTGDAWTTLVDRTGNTSTAQTYTDTLANGSNKRYLRVTITGYQGGYFWASLFEVKVFAASGGGGGGGTTSNLSQGKTATASSTESGKTPAMANDGSNTTRWAAANANFPAWWEVDLGSAKTVSSAELMFEGSSAWKYRIEGRATTGDAWTTLVDRTGNTSTAQTYTNTLANGSNKRYIRVTITGYQGGYFWASLFEAKIFGQ